MSGISSLGVGSGLDLSALVDNLVMIERSAGERPLTRMQLRAETRLSALGTLKAAVSALVGELRTLGELAVGRKATSSADGVLTATATADAEAGTYRIEVLELASAQSLASDALDPFTDLDQPLGEGTLTLSVGGETAAIEIGAGENSLQAIRDAINASAVDVQAVTVRDGDGYRLLLTSGVSGSAGEITLTIDGTLDPRLASAAMEETLAASDAKFRLNGLTLTADSNSVDDVIAGVTFQLRSTTEAGEAVTVDVAPSTAGVHQKLAAVVGVYNALVEKIAALGNARAGAGAAGALVGDAALRALQDRIGAAFAESLDTDLADNPFSSAVDLGLRKDAQGKAKLDTDALNAALELSEGGVESLLSAFGERLSNSLDAFAAAGGILTVRTDQLNAEIARIGRQREALNRRMEQVEARLRKRFTALDSLVSRFQNTSAFLAQRLAALQTISPQ